MKNQSWWLLLFVCLGMELSHRSSAAEETTPVRIDFSRPDILKAFTGVGDFARIVDGRSGRKCLQIDFSNVPKGEGGMIVLQIPPEQVRGNKVVLSGWLKGENVSTPSGGHLGIKIMLYVKSTKGEVWKNPTQLYGTFDWRQKAIGVTVDESATEVRLYLGLQGVTGKAWFDDVRIGILRPLVNHEYRPVEGAAFRGHEDNRLRGAMSAFRPTTADIEVLAGAWKANLLRYQMSGYPSKGKAPDLFESEAYDHWLEEKINALDQILPVCQKNGMRVVVDLHSAPGGQKNIFQDKRCQDKLVAVWERLAVKYKGNPTIWGYDLLNEPQDNDWNPLNDTGVLDWQKLSERVARAIRAIDAIVPIIVEVGEWSAPEGFAQFQPLDVPRTIYSVHLYSPIDYTHQGVERRPMGLGYPGIARGEYWDKARLRRELEQVRAFQTRNNVHIYVGEFSAIRWAPGAAQYLSDCIDLFEEYGWDWSYHAFREWNGWSVEHTADPNNQKPSSVITDRQKILQSWFGKNTPVRNNAGN